MPQVGKRKFGALFASENLKEARLRNRSLDAELARQNMFYDICINRASKLYSYMAKQEIRRQGWDEEEARLLYEQIKKESVQRCSSEVHSSYNVFKSQQEFKKEWQERRSRHSALVTDGEEAAVQDGGPYPLTRPSSQGTKKLLDEKPRTTPGQRDLIERNRIIQRIAVPVFHAKMTSEDTQAARQQLENKKWRPPVLEKDLQDIMKTNMGKLLTCTLEDIQKQISTTKKLKDKKPKSHSKVPPTGDESEGNIPDVELSAQNHLFGTAGYIPTERAKTEVGFHTNSIGPIKPVTFQAETIGNKLKKSTVYPLEDDDIKEMERIADAKARRNTDSLLLQGYLQHGFFKEADALYPHPDIDAMLKKRSSIFSSGSSHKHDMYTIKLIQDKLNGAKERREQIAQARIKAVKEKNRQREERRLLIDEKRAAIEAERRMESLQKRADVHKQLEEAAKLRELKALKKGKTLPSGFYRSPLSNFMDAERKFEPSRATLNGIGMAASTPVLSLRRTSAIAPTVHRSRAARLSAASEQDFYKELDKRIELESKRLTVLMNRSHQDSDWLSEFTKLEEDLNALKFIRDTYFAKSQEGPVLSTDEAAAALNNRLLRLTTQNVQDLENILLRDGKDPGFHAHMTEERILAAFNSLNPRRNRKYQHPSTHSLAATTSSGSGQCQSQPQPANAYEKYQTLVTDSDESDTELNNPTLRINLLAKMEEFYKRFEMLKIKRDSLHLLSDLQKESHLSASTDDEDDFDSVNGE